MANPTQVTQYLEASLRAATLRQKVIANNIANIDTPGYRRQTVNFEQILSSAIRQGRPVEMDKLNESIIQTSEGPLNERGNDVDLDVEMGELIKNASQYKTYCRMLSRLYRQMDQAMSGME
ncbi:MAG: flagellar basal body rod protein FlgB [candidate division NC10 bacterium]